MDIPRIIYATILLILTFFQKRDIITKINIDTAIYRIGMIENEEDEEIVAFKLSTEYAKMTWSKGIVRLQKYSVKSVEIIA